ncbi:MAG: transcriptional regulator [Candidatus Asgardarchaeia archaeon]
MAKDKIYGALLLVASLLIIIYYTYCVILTPWGKEQFFVDNPPIAWLPALSSYWSIAIPIWLAIVLVFLIVAWIGWTMLTTPPPVPLEELEEEEEETSEEQSEEPKTEAESKTE